MMNGNPALEFGERTRDTSESIKFLQAVKDLHHWEHVVVVLVILFLFPELVPSMQGVGDQYDHIFIGMSMH